MYTHPADYSDTYEPALAARIRALLAELPPLQAERLALILRDVDDARLDSAVAEADAHWERFLAHLPGIAPALSVLWWHVWNNERTPRLYYA